MTFHIVRFLVELPFQNKLDIRVWTLAQYVSGGGSGIIVEKKVYVEDCPFK